MINVGLLMPHKIVNKAVIFAEKNNVNQLDKKALFDKLLDGENLFEECTNVKEAHILEQEILGFQAENTIKLL